MKTKAVFKRIAGLVLAVIFVLSPLAVGGELKIVHINVGQGDATLILGPEDASGARVSVLVDAGELTNSKGHKDGGVVVGAALRANGVDRLNYFIATHYDADHIGGVVTGKVRTHGHSFVLGPNNCPGKTSDDDGDGIKNWHDSKKVAPDADELGLGDDVVVDCFIDRGWTETPSSKTFKKYKALVLASASKSKHIIIANQADVDGYELSLGDGATMTCLASNGYVRVRNEQVELVDRENERSLCFLVDYGGFDYVIGGDVIGRKAGRENAPVEKAIGKYLQGKGINVDVIQVNHHGANNTSETEYLKAVAPEVAVITVGDGNTHHHPHADALKRLADAGVKRIYQTEKGETRGFIDRSAWDIRTITDGDIVLTTDGVTYKITAAGGTPWQRDVDG